MKLGKNEPTILFLLGCLLAGIGFSRLIEHNRRSAEQGGRAGKEPATVQLPLARGYTLHGTWLEAPVVDADRREGQLGKLAAALHEAGATALVIEVAPTQYATGLGGGGPGPEGGRRRHGRSGSCWAGPSSRRACNSAFWRKFPMAPTPRGWELGPPPWVRIFWP